MADNDDDDDDDGGESENSEDDEELPEEEEPEESGDENADLELRKKIEEALRVNGIEPATDGTDEDSDEELMDDDQMMAIDEQLADVFRSRANEKKSGKGQTLFEYCDDKTLFMLHTKTSMLNERRLISKTASSTLLIPISGSNPQVRTSSVWYYPWLNSLPARGPTRANFQIKPKDLFDHVLGS